MMSVNGVILYEKVRTGTKYLLQLSLLLSFFTHCYYTGLLCGELCFTHHCMWFFSFFSLTQIFVLSSVFIFCIGC